MTTTAKHTDIPKRDQAPVVYQERENGTSNLCVFIKKGGGGGGVLICKYSYILRQAGIIITLLPVIRTHATHDTVHTTRQ